MLSLSSKHAIKILVELAQKTETRFFSVPEIVRDKKAPGPYIAKIIKHLAKNKLVETRKGPGGGVRITARGRKATFYDICEAFNEGVVRDSCFLSKKACNPNTPCPLHSSWLKARSQMIAFLKKNRIRQAAAPRTN